MTNDEYMYPGSYVEKLHLELNEEHRLRLEAEAKLHDGILTNKDALAEKIIECEKLREECKQWRKRYTEACKEIKRITEQLEALCKTIWKLIP